MVVVVVVQMQVHLQLQVQVQVQVWEQVQVQKCRCRWGCRCMLTFRYRCRFRCKGHVQGERAWARCKVKRHDRTLRALVVGLRKELLFPSPSVSQITPRGSRMGLIGLSKLLYITN